MDGLGEHPMAIAVGVAMVAVVGAYVLLRGLAKPQRGGLARLESAGNSAETMLKLVKEAYTPAKAPSQAAVRPPTPTPAPAPAPALTISNSSAEQILNRVLETASVSEDELPASLRPRLLQQINRVRDLEIFIQHIKTSTAPYSSANPEHEALLEKLWDLVRPGVRRSGRITREWEEIGFQGQDPATDFRGMGLLGLQNLIWIAEKYPKLTRRILDDSLKPNWFSFAITGINLTFDVLKLTTSRKLDPFFLQRGPNIDSFSSLYVLAFLRFNQAWTAANPVNVFAFKDIHDSFVSDFEKEATTLNLDPKAIAQSFS